MTTSDYFDPGNYAVRNTRARAEQIQALAQAVGAGFAKLPSLAQLLGSSATFGIITQATPNALALSVPGLANMPDGTEVSGKVVTTTTGPVTLNVNGSGALSVVTPSLEALSPSALRAGAMPVFKKSGTTWQVITPTEAQVAAVAAQVAIAAAQAALSAEAAEESQRIASSLGAVEVLLPLFDLDPDTGDASIAFQDIEFVPIDGAKGSMLFDGDTGEMNLKLNALRIQSLTGRTVLSAFGEGGVLAYYKEQIRLKTTAEGIDLSGKLSGAESLDLAKILTMGAQPATPVLPGADKGGYWAKAGNPTKPMFTDSAGAEIDLSPQVLPQRDFEVVQRFTAASGATIDMPLDVLRYEAWELDFGALLTSVANARIYLRFSEDGTVFPAGATDYQWMARSLTEGNVTTTDGGRAGSIPIGLNGNNLNGRVRIHGAHRNNRTAVTYDFVSTRADGTASFDTGGGTAAAATIHRALRLVVGSSAAFAGGRIVLWGMRRE